jgi:hypothetical protein
MQRMINAPTTIPMMTAVWVDIGFEPLLVFDDEEVGEGELLLAVGLSEPPVADTVGLDVVVPFAVDVAWFI